jgi:ABC-type spermidine/putrescine transport system permease subunit II
MRSGFGVEAVGRILAWAMVFVLLVPLFVTVVLSFNSTTNVSWPPAGFSLDWYWEAFRNRRLLEVVGNSARLALATALATTVIGTVAGFAIARYGGRFGRIVLGLALVPLLAPPILIALGLVVLVTSVGFKLSFGALWLGHVTIALPFAVLIVASHASALDRRLEDASTDLGASWLRTMAMVVLPQLVPAIRSSFFFAFIISFNEVVLAIFLAGADQTFPAFMFGLFKQVITPEFYAASSFMVLIAVVFLIAERATVRAIQRLR